MWPMTERENRHSWSYCGQTVFPVATLNDFITVLLLTSTPVDQSYGGMFKWG